MSVASQMNGVQEFKRNEVHTDVARSSPTQGPIVRESQRDDTDGLGTASAATTLGVQTYTLTKIIAAISAIISFFCLAEAFVLWSLPVPYFFSITANVTVIVSALLFFFGFRKGIPLPVKFFFWGCGFQSIARLLVAGWLGIVAILGVGNSAKLMQMANVTGGVINGLLQIFMSIAIVNVVLSVAFAFFTWIAFRFNKQFQMYGVNR